MSKMKVRTWLGLAFLMLALLMASCINPNPGSGNGPDQAKAVVLNRHEMTMSVNDTVRLSYTLNVKDARVEWSSSDESVVTVNNRGMVVAKKLGMATVKATANGESDECVVYVKADMEQLKFTLAAIPFDPDTTFFGGELLPTTMSGEPVYVYKSLLTLYLLSEGLYLNDDRELAGASEGAIIVVKAPILYGTPAQNGGRTIATIAYAKGYQSANPYKADWYTFEPGKIDATKYVESFKRYCELYNVGEISDAQDVLYDAAEFVQGARVVSVSFVPEFQSYVMNDLPEAIVDGGRFVLDTKGPRPGTYNIKSMEMTVLPMDTTSFWGVALQSNENGVSLADEMLHFGEPVKYTYP